MPVYEFKCQSCGEIFSKIRRMGDFHTEECPVCHSDKVEKIISSFTSSSTSPSCAPSGGG